MNHDKLEIKDKTIDKFYSKIIKSANNDDCWNWNGLIDHNNPSFEWMYEGQRRKLSAKKLIWYLHFGFLILDNQIRTLCKNKICVNPQHLIIVGYYNGKKFCPSCNLHKNISEFRVVNERADGYNGWCSDCVVECANSIGYTKVRRERCKSTIEFIRQIKESSPCLDCNKFYPACAMDFDHIHENKFLSVSKMESYSKEKILEEISKCELVCANCHRIRTYNRKYDMKS